MTCCKSHASRPTYDQVRNGLSVDRAAATRGPASRSRRGRLRLHGGQLGDLALVHLLRLLDPKPDGS